MDNQNAVYVISLDAVDLNLLPSLYNTRNNNVAPLWSRSNLEMRSNDYYQFEIKCNESKTCNEEPPPKLHYENKICHICDIEVPKPFMSEHIQSSRHKTNVEIADIAMQRMKNHLSNVNNECDERVDPSAHFCPTCVTIIDSRDRSVHEKSVQHVNSTMMERIFKDFLVLYHFNKANEHMTDKEQNSDSKETKNDLAHRVVDERVVKPKKVAKDVPQENTVEPMVKNELNNPLLSINDFIDSLNKGLDKVAMFLKVIEENFIEIECVDGSIVKVTDDHFHGFITMSRRTVQCFLCKCIVKNKLLFDHMVSETHMKNLIIPLKNKHCLRKISENHAHCLICNVMTEFPDLHVLCNNEHEKLLKDALVSDKLDENYPSTSSVNTPLPIQQDEPSTSGNAIHESNSHTNSIEPKALVTNEIAQNSNPNVSILPNTEISKDNTVEVDLKVTAKSIKFHCKICNVYSNTNGIEKHNNSQRHILNLKSNYHYLMSEIDDKNLLCTVCDTTVNNNVEDVLKHVNDEGHKKAYNMILKDNKMKRINKERLFCQTCEVVVLSKIEFIHIKSKQHQKNKFIAEKNEETQDNHVVISNHAKVNDNHEQTQDIVNSGETQENEGAREHHEGESSNETFEAYQCTVCNVTVPNNVNNIQEHLNGRVHLRNLETQSTEDIESVVSDAKYDLTIHYTMEQTKFPTLLKCRVCNMIILYNDTSILNHLKESKHTSNYETLMKTNHLTMLPNNIYCQLCLAYVGIKSELMHISGRRHMRNLVHRNMQNSITNLEVNQAEVVIQNEGPIQSEAFVQAALNLNIKPEMIEQLIEGSDTGSVICKVCQVKLPFSENNVRTHINGVKHMQNQRLKMGL